MHPEAYTGFKQMVSDLGLTMPMRVLDLGGRDVNGTVHDLLHPDCAITVLDQFEHPSVDIVADCRAWRASERAWDLVVSTEMLEHVDDWRGILAAAASALVPDGHLLLTCASIGRPEHGQSGGPAPLPGEHYGNVSATDLGVALAGLFSEHSVTYNPTPGDVYAWARGFDENHG